MYMYLPGSSGTANTSLCGGLSSVVLVRASVGSVTLVPPI
jgi:hypothetical protein